MAGKTVTIDTNEWVYPDVSGTPHTVTNAQTFTFTLTDGGVAAVQYAIDTAQTLTTTDGYTLHFRPRGDVAGNALYIGFLADANNAGETHYNRGEIEVEDPTSGILQRWRISKLTVDDVDAPTSISMTCEDQFGNRFSWDGVTVAAS